MLIGTACATLPTILIQMLPPVLSPVATPTCVITRFYPLAVLSPRTPIPKPSPSCP